MERINHILEYEDVGKRRKFLATILQENDETTIVDVLSKVAGYTIVATQKDYETEQTDCLQYVLGTNDFSYFSNIISRSSHITPEQRQVGDYVIYFHGDELTPLTFGHIAFVTDNNDLLSKMGPRGPLVRPDRNS